MMSVFETVEHHVDLCVVGGGLSGMCAAISAARHGLRVVIMHDRPMFGGNASGEIRMWVCGAHGKDNRETGLMEEIALENLYRNPYRVWPVWDIVLYEKVKQEENITAILNCSCNDIEMDGDTIKAVIGWQLTTQKRHKVYATYFADCSGDSILAPLSGAECRWGREASAEFGESIAPLVADKKTMGMSCLIQAREMPEKRTFIPPSWAYRYTKESLPYRIPDMTKPKENFWYMELGGEADTIADSEEVRDELLKVAMGIWDYVKNSGDINADNWELDFLGFLPGKRESRRYVGDYIMNQRDVEAGGLFEDTIAYGGWSMDDHHPGGILTKERPTIYHPAPSPFGIPYRCVYSKNIGNLFFAGRNISVTHSAMSATRVMATCAILGQAVGTAAFVAHRYAMSPRDVYHDKMKELQQTLIYDDCYLPHIKAQWPAFMQGAAVTCGGRDLSERLLNGEERQFEKNGVEVTCGEPLVVAFSRPKTAERIRIVLDSDLNRETIGARDFIPEKATICNIPLCLETVHLPEYLAKNIQVDFMDENSDWHPLCTVCKNRKRLLNIAVRQKCAAIRITPQAAWGGEKVRLFSIGVF